MKTYSFQLICGAMFEDVYIKARSRREAQRKADAMALAVFRSQWARAVVL